MRILGNKHENDKTRKGYLIFGAMWIFFGVLLLVQHQFVYMHFDDFGYASLSYGYNGNTNGMNWTLGDFLRYLAWHYFNWGGRILFYGAEILALRCGEWFIQLLQAVLIWFISWFSYLLVRREKRDIVAGGIIIIFYGMIGLSTVSDGLFWYSASAGYVWPFAFLFSGIYLLEKQSDSKSSRRIAGILFFIAGFSHEQVAVLVIVFIVTRACMELFISKNADRKYLPVYAAGIIGSLIEICAPGNFARTASESNVAFYDLSFIEKAKTTIPAILEANLGDFLVIVLLIITLGISYFYILKHVQKKIIFSVLGVIDTFVGLAIFYPLYNSENQMLVNAIRVLFVLIIFFQVSVYLFIERKLYLLALFVGGVCSQGMMIMSPSMGNRCTLPFQIVLHVIAADMFLYAFMHLKKWIISVCTLGVACIAICNVGYITLGYYNNAEINLINRYKLREKAVQIKAGDEVDAIILYRLRDDRFTSQMPYQQDFIKYWVKNYFEIPQSTNFIWQELGTVGNAHEIVVMEKPQISSVWPEIINGDTERCEDGGVNIAVIPMAMDQNTVIIINGHEMSTVYDDGFLSTHVEKDMLTADLKIQILDTVSQQISEEAVLKVVN